jgi:hypothetical protein
MFQQLERIFASATPMAVRGLLELAHDAPHWDADEILAVTESADAVSP